MSARKRFDKLLDNPFFTLPVLIGLLLFMIWAINHIDYSKPAKKFKSNIQKTIK